MLGEKGDRRNNNAWHLLFLAKRLFYLKKERRGKKQEIERDGNLKL
jgi:hypothetical protein